MKNRPQNPRQIRLERLFSAHAAVEKATREAIQSQPDQADAFGRRCVETENAKSPLYATVKMSVAEAHALLSLALPRAARTIPLRRDHALLMIAISQVLDELAAIDTEDVPHTAITAAQHLAVQLRDWLVSNNQVVMSRNDKWSDDMTGRRRTPDAQSRLPKGKTVPITSPFRSWHRSHSDAARSAGLTVFTGGKKANGR